MTDPTDLSGALPGPPYESFPTPPQGNPGQVLALVRSHGDVTRAELVERTGLSRATVGARLEALQQAGLITAAEITSTSRGRPPSRFRFRHEGGALLIADSGATGVRLAVTDLAGAVLDQSRLTLDIASGPEHWLSEVVGAFGPMLTELGLGSSDVRGIGLALPGPVDSVAGMVVSPPIMTGWDRYPIRSHLAAHFACPVVVENDANAMAIGEHRLAHPHVSSMLMLKLATGIGAGLIAGGQLYRGADGAAGDIGHIQVVVPEEGEPPQCRCGNQGCIEAYAGGWAIVRDLRAAGEPVTSVHDAVQLIATGDPTATRLLRRAGRIIGIALSDAVSLLNPEVVVIGGELAAAENHLFAGIRESVYARSLPLATRRLQIVPAAQRDMAGVSGLVTALCDHLYEPTRVDALVAASATS
ncbi:putative NBD/HSP70 family sugar kinase [Humibacillus xanthopallidus]|uniref:Putative NBD/HSP70 family sugar kinase n=1 Tax=Humibacillus xanthopallidus TaxID=412689 RepID=A0A543PM93_9MICO|nr:ROK family transcriptional regulator [Humibacillus xanthopallidus]TQN45198.1 putative NBD/HSP70 family sugar kinase [Humibacillus xanthopallidus]